MTFSQQRQWADAQDRHRRLVKNLRASDLPGDHCLAEVLAACADSRPCGSGACPYCGIDFQRAAVDLAKREIILPARARLRGRAHALTLVPASGCVEPAYLNARVMHEVRDEVADALKRCNIPPTLGALDVSFNEDVTDRVPTHACVHGHFIGSGWLSKRQLEALRACFPPTTLSPRPVHSVWLDRDPKALSYSFKPERVRRESYAVPATDRRGAYRDTKRRSLRPAQAMAIARVEHEVGYRGRLINHGIEAGAVEAVIGGVVWARDGP